MNISDSTKERIAESLASWVENDLAMILDDAETQAAEEARNELLDEVESWIDKLESWVKDKKKDIQLYEAFNIMQDMIRMDAVAVRKN